jgi:hypothetical protein
MRLNAYRLLLAVLVVVVPPAAALAATAPTLRVVQERPLVLSGARFKPNEAVRITVRTSSRTLARDTRAGVRGGFRVEFRGVKVNFCTTSLSIVARGAASGTVRARLPRPVCANP